MPPPKPAPHRLTDAEMKSKSGKTWDQWFKVLDDFGGPARGRREIGNFLADTHKMDAQLTATVNVEYEAARGVVEKDGRPKGYMICATKTIGAPAATVFSAWSTEKGWNSWFTRKAELDFREGGRYATDDGNAGEFKKIRENKAIKFTWENPKHTPGTVVETTFQPKGDGRCVVMVAHDRIQTRVEADELRAVWGGALDRLKALLERER